jgi:hypothetical protein
MANRYLNQFVLNPRKGMVQEVGTINLSAAAAVSSHTFSSLIASVVKSATGTYTITLADKWVGHFGVQVSVQSSLDTVSAAIVSVDAASAKTVVLKTLIGGAAADVTAASVLHVSLILKNSTAR